MSSPSTHARPSCGCASSPISPSRWSPSSPRQAASHARRLCQISLRAVSRSRLSYHHRASHTITGHLTPSPHRASHIVSLSLSLSLSLSFSLSRIRLAYHTHHRTPLTRLASHIVGSRSLGRSGASTSPRQLLHCPPFLGMDPSFSLVATILACRFETALVIVSLPSSCPFVPSEHTHKFHFSSQLFLRSFFRRWLVTRVFTQKCAHTAPRSSAPSTRCSSSVS